VSSAHAPRIRLKRLLSTTIIAIDSQKEPRWARILWRKPRTNCRALLDEALSGEIVTITRHGKAVVSLTPTAPALLPLTKADIEQMRRRAMRPSLGADSVTLVREMRDEEP
jgi:antitoxin (DNA-binding transcriptional repressor) of toxin-antitoxin stability system